MHWKVELEAGQTLSSGTPNPDSCDIFVGCVFLVICVLRQKVWLLLYIIVTLIPSPIPRGPAPGGTSNSRVHITNAVRGPKANAPETRTPKPLRSPLTRSRTRRAQAS